MIFVTKFIGYKGTHFIAKSSGIQISIAVESHFFCCRKLTTCDEEYDSRIIENKGHLILKF